MSQPTLDQGPMWSRLRNRHRSSCWPILTRRSAALRSPVGLQITSSSSLASRFALIPFGRRPRTSGRTGPMERSRRPRQRQPSHASPTPRRARRPHPPDAHTLTHACPRPSGADRRARPSPSASPPRRPPALPVRGRTTPHRDMLGAVDAPRHDVSRGQRLPVDLVDSSRRASTPGTRSAASGRRPARMGEAAAAASVPIQLVSGYRTTRSSRPRSLLGHVGGYEQACEPAPDPGTRASARHSDRRPERRRRGPWEYPMGEHPGRCVDGANAARYGSS